MLGNNRNHPLYLTSLLWSIGKLGNFPVPRNAEVFLMLTNPKQRNKWEPQASAGNWAENICSPFPGPQWWVRPLEVAFFVYLDLWGGPWTKFVLCTLKPIWLLWLEKGKPTSWGGIIQNCLPGLEGQKNSISIWTEVLKECLLDQDIEGFLHSQAALHLHFNCRFQARPLWAGKLLPLCTVSGQLDTLPHCGQVFLEDISLFNALVSASFGVSASSSPFERTLSIILTMKQEVEFQAVSLLLKYLL